jgi:hypothetical protein
VRAVSTPLAFAEVSAPPGPHAALRLAEGDGQQDERTDGRDQHRVAAIASDTPPRTTVPRKALPSPETG